MYFKSYFAISNNISDLISKTTPKRPHGDRHCQSIGWRYLLTSCL
jgi:hypothetical protein